MSTPFPLQLQDGEDDPHLFLGFCQIRPETSPDALCDRDLLASFLQGTLTADQLDRLVAGFPDLWPLAMAGSDRLSDLGVPAPAVRRLQLLKATALRARAAAAFDGPIINSWDRTRAYLSQRLSAETREHFLVLYLDRKNRLIEEDVSDRGTIDHVACYPREIARRCIRIDAGAVILAHNHPSGDPMPSRADIDTTRQIDAALKAIGVALHDHIVVGRGDAIRSFKTMELL